MIRAMAKQAEAERTRRAKSFTRKASAGGADCCRRRSLAKEPALQLRYLQTLVTSPTTNFHHRVPAADGLIRRFSTAQGPYRRRDGVLLTPTLKAADERRRKTSW